MTTLQNVLRRAPLAGVLVALLLLFLGPLAAVHAAGSATIRDDAGLFTSVGRNRITQAAQQANVRVVVITNNQRFSTLAAWRSWLKGQATDANAITIGLHAVPGQQRFDAVPGANTGISQSQADQGAHDGAATARSSGATAGVVSMINEYHGMGATAGSQSGSGGSSIGWLVPLIVLALLAFLVMRLFGRRRRTFAPPGYGPGPYQGGPYQGGYGPTMGSGGGAGRGFLGGLAGGVAGSFIGNELFGNRDGGNANAADPNAGNVGPADTPEAQSLQGGWSGGDAGGASPADAGGWSGGDAGGGWSGGDSGGGWSGGDAGGGGGWDNSGGGDSGGGWT